MQTRSTSTMAERNVIDFGQKHYVVGYFDDNQSNIRWNDNKRLCFKVSWT